ncbi:MAG TPA: AAA family ATPase [Solirubrobacteraceae bacterium]|nr:AAA family ATPase [Solirubrobacteraceae bacterium]
MLSLFGGLDIRAGDRDVAAELPGRQGRALVAYLALNCERRVGRDELVDVLWPAQPPASPEAALNSVLAKVRRVLGADVIRGRQALTLELPAGSRIDARTLIDEAAGAERSLAERDPSSALEAAQAVVETLSRRLLPELDGEWVDSWRRRLDELAPRALEISAQAALQLGDAHLPAAERAAAALIEREPFRECGYDLLMQAQARQGNVAEALRSFDRLRCFLRDELGASPSPSLVALHERLLREEPVAAPANAVVEPQTLPVVSSQVLDGAFVGREQFLARLRTRWQETRCGQTRLVLLVGEAGVGKTRLAAEFADEVRADGGTALYGRADEEALLPHQPFVEALRQLLSHGDAALAAAVEQDRAILCRLLPDLAPRSTANAAEGDDPTLRYRLSEAVAALLCTASRRAPLLLILDDLHWADKPTLLLLRHLLRHPQLARLLVVGTFRHVEVGRDHPLVDLLTDLRRERRYDRLTLAGLDDAATEALVRDRVHDPVAPEFVHRLREQTEGNPFFIEETLRALLDTGPTGDESLSVAALERIGVPEGVAEIVERRVRHLSPLGDETLKAASVFGRDFRAGVVARVIGADAEDVICALEESMAAGLVLEVADRVDVYTFSHTLVREALYSRLSVSRRVRLHLAVAEALEALAEHEHVNPAELAHHFLLARHFAGPGPARRYSIAAGARATELLAYEEAAEHFAQAVQLFDDDDEAARCDILLALGRAQWRAGSDEARQTFRTVATSAAARGDAEQLARAALGHSARYHESGYAGSRDRELLEQARAALADGDSALRVLLLSRLAGTVAFAGEQRDRAPALSAEALAMARRLRDRGVLRAALMAHHATLLDVRDLDERLKISAEFMVLPEGRPELAAECHHWRIFDLLEAGDAGAARALQPQLETLAKHMRQPQWHSIAAGWRGVWAELAGDVTSAEQCAEECLQQGQRAGMKDALSLWTGKLLMLRRRQGRLGELSSAVERLLRGADVRRTGWRSAFALICADAGDAGAARAIYREELPAYAGAMPQFWLTNMAMLTELCAELGDADGARRLYSALLPCAHRSVVVTYASYWGPVERYLAMLAATFGDDELRRRHAQRALARTRALNAPLLTAELLEHHGDVLDA